MRFLGNIEAKADSKGRVFLPAGFRKVLQASGEEVLVLRKDVYQKCLVLFPESVWNARLDLLKAQMSPWKPAHQQMFRQFVSEAETVALDGNGQDIRVIGMDDTIEIWSPQHLEEVQQSDEAFSAAFEDIMNGESRQ